MPYSRPPTYYLGFAPDDSAADKRYRDTFSNDPYPEIPPSLLTSADLEDYIRTTGLVYPFSENRLKSASFSASIGDQWIYWDDKGVRREVNLRTQQTVVLEPNSLAYVTTLEKFRLPNYIALRFNLKINFVHRGILIGTGPIVDPGFEGHLVVPLHNFTANPYTFRHGETFIWIELTKTTPNAEWSPNDTSTYGVRFGTYRPFPNEKKNLTIHQYLHDATTAPTIRTGMTDAVDHAVQASEASKAESQRAANQANDAAGQAQSAREYAQTTKENSGRILRNFTIVGVLGVFFGTVGCIWQFNSWNQQVNSIVLQARQMFDSYKLEFEKFRTEDGKPLGDEVKLLRQKIIDIEGRLPRQ